MTGFWFTGILLVFYLFHIVEKFYKMPWLKIEFVFCALWTLLYVIAASLAVSYSVVEAFVAAGVSILFNYVIKKILMNVFIMAVFIPALKTWSFT